MPTKERMNISLVDTDTISKLYILRDELEDVKNTRLSLADVIKALLAAQPDIGKLARHI